MALVIVTAIVIVLILGYCWAVKLEDALECGPDEPSDFWMTDD